MNLESPANKCFVCGPGNKSGLNVRFSLSDDGNCHARWTSSQQFLGYDGVTHGGIVFCLLDDVMANLLFLKGEVCMTAKADVRFRNALGIGETILLSSYLVKRRRNLAIISGKAVRESDNTLIATAEAHFMVTAKHSD